jgi:hypothetical protein
MVGDRNCQQLKLWNYSGETLPVLPKLRLLGLDGKPQMSLLLQRSINSLSVLVFAATLIINCYH